MVSHRIFVLPDLRSLLPSDWRPISADLFSLLGNADLDVWSMRRGQSSAPQIADGVADRNRCNRKGMGDNQPLDRRRGCFTVPHGSDRDGCVGPAAHMRGHCSSQKPIRDGDLSLSWWTCRAYRRRFGSDSTAGMVAVPGRAGEIPFSRKKRRAPSMALPRGKCAANFPVLQATDNRVGLLLPLALLIALVASGEQRDVEWLGSRRGLFRFGVGVFADSGALRVDANPAAAEALEDVGEDAFFIDLGGVDLVVESVGSISHGDVAQHADGDDFLGEVDSFVFAGEDLGQLLIAGGDIAAGGYIDEQR